MQVCLKWEKDLEAKKRVEYYINLEKKRKMFFQKMYKELFIYFTTLYEKVVKVIDSDNFDSEAYLTAKIQEKKLKTLLMKNYKDIVEYFSNITMQELTNKKQMSFDVWTGLFLAKLETGAGEKITNINNTVLMHIRRELQRGTLAGESIHELSERLMNEKISFSRVRAICVARTEVIGTSNGASFETARFIDGGDGRLKKNWITTIDGRERPWHSDADGQTVGINEKFIVFGEELDYPGDPMGSAENVINCRCASSFEK